MNEKQCVRRKIISFQLLRMLSITRSSYWEQKEDEEPARSYSLRGCVQRFSCADSVSWLRKVYKTSPPPGDWTNEERTLCSTRDRAGFYAQHKRVIFNGNLSILLIYFVVNQRTTLCFRKPSQSLTIF